MRKSITAIALLALVLLLAPLNTKAQQEPSENAFGLRFGASSGFGYEASYQRMLRPITRLEITVGNISSKTFRRFRLTGAYQWVLPMTFVKEDGFFLFAGLGGSTGHHRWKDTAFGTRNGIFVNALAQIGVEYHFEFPIQVALDWRPEFGVINSNAGPDYLQIFLSLRYKF